MRKIISKIAGTLLGLSLAVGVGVAIGGAKSSEHVSVHAADATATFTMKGFGGLTATGYQNSAVSGSGEKSSGGTIAASSYGFNASNGQVRGNKTAAAGASPSSDSNKNWHLFNTAPFPGAIKSIVITAGAGSGTGYGFKGTMSVALGTSNMGDTTSGGTSVSPTKVGSFTDTFTFSGLNDSSSYTYFKVFSTVAFTSGSITEVSVVVTFEDGGEEVDTLTGITANDPKTDYTAGDSFVKPSVTAHYSISGDVDVSSDAIFSGYDLSTPGNQTVSVSYTDPDDAVAQTSYSIYVAEPPIDMDSLYSCDFTSVETHSYTQDKEFTLNEKSWTASVSQVNSGVFYLGCNSTHAAKGILNDNSTFADVVTALSSADSTYAENVATAHAYALLFDNAYDHVGAIRFTWSGGNNAFQVYVFGDTGSGYVELSHVNYSDSGSAVPGSLTWIAPEALNISKIAIVARPGAQSSTATSKTLRAATFEIFEAPAEAYNANQFSQELLDATDAVCALVSEKTTQQMVDALTSIWDTLKGVEKYGALSDGDKTTLGEAERDQSGTVVERAMARYDQLTGKYELENFIVGRTPVAFAPANIQPSTANTNSMTIVIVVVALTSITSIGVLLVIKRKRSLVK